MGKSSTCVLQEGGVVKLGAGPVRAGLHGPLDVSPCSPGVAKLQKSLPIGQEPLGMVGIKVNGSL